MTLPPGQRRVEGFPRFGIHMHRPPPASPDEPVIEVMGAVREPVTVPLTRLADLPRTELDADFHCVAGWSATGLRWEGVAFTTFYTEVIAPALRLDEAVTHLVLRGLDGYRSIVTLEDALGEDVLLADRLDGQPLDGDHGGPVRFVSPRQYGFISTKHLCRIELHTTAPARSYHRSPLLQFGLRALVTPHERARVWEEERHRHLPAWLLRPVYRALIGPFRALAARGSESNVSR